jgi:hypothetical protein
LSAIADAHDLQNSGMWLSLLAKRDVSWSCAGKMRWGMKSA